MDSFSFIELIIGMWIIAIVSFAPLAYFIYIFNKSDGQSFGKADPESHKVEDSKYYSLINNTMNAILGGSGKADVGNAEPIYQSEPDSSATDSSAASTPQSASDQVVGKGYGSMPVKR